jgi:hypothetical protein
MISLKDGLDNIAQRAKVYGDLDAAVITARRRRRAAQATVAGIAVLALAVGGLAITRSVGQHSGSPIHSAVGVGLTVTPPVATPPVLPTDRGVGVGAALYQPTVDGPVWLYTADGHWYTTAVDGGAMAARDVMPLLSPDGRWMLWGSGQSVELRDLTGSTRRTAPNSLLRAWSPDSRYAVLQGDGNSAATAGLLTRLDLTTGATHVTNAGSLLQLTDAQLQGDQLMGSTVGNDGDLLIPAPPTGSGDLDLVRVDPITHAVASRVHVVDPLPAGAANATTTVLAGPGRTALVTRSWQIRIDDTHYRPFQSSTVRVDLTTGRTTKVTGTGSATILADRTDGILLAQRRSSTSLQLVLLNPRTGSRQELIDYQLNTDDRLLQLRGMID